MFPSGTVVRSHCNDHFRRTPNPSSSFVWSFPCLCAPAFHSTSHKPNHRHFRWLPVFVDAVPSPSKAFSIPSFQQVSTHPLSTDSRMPPTQSQLPLCAFVFILLVSASAAVMSSWKCSSDSNSFMLRILWIHFPQRWPHLVKGWKYHGSEMD